MNPPPSSAPSAPPAPDPFNVGMADPMMAQQQQAQQQAFKSFLDQNQQQSTASQPNYSYAAQPQPQPQPQFNGNSSTNMNVNMGSNYGISAQAETSPSMWQRLTSVFKFETYAAYFDVTTHDIKHRMMNS